MNNKPLIATFQMTIDGTRVTYTRPVHVTDSRELSGVDQTGRALEARAPALGAPDTPCV